MTLSAAPGSCFFHFWDELQSSARAPWWAHCELQLKVKSLTGSRALACAREPYELNRGAREPPPACPVDVLVRGAADGVEQRSSNRSQSSKNCVTLCVSRQEKKRACTPARLVADQRSLLEQKLGGPARRGEAKSGPVKRISQRSPMRTNVRRDWRN